MDNNLIGYLIDLNVSLSIRKNRVEVLFTTRNKLIAQLLSSSLNMKIYGMGNNYAMSGKSGKFLEIYEKYKNYLFLNKSRFEFLFKFLKERPVWNGINKKEQEDYRNSKRVDYSAITQDRLTGNEPIEYQKFYLDNLSDFQFSKMDDKYSLFWQKNSENQDIIHNYNTVLNDFAYTVTVNGKKTYLRAKKEDSLKIVDYIYDLSFNKDFFNIFKKAANTLDMKEREGFYPEFEKIKNSQIDRSLFSAQTNQSRSEDRVNRKIVAKEERLKIKQEYLNKIEQDRLLRKEKKELQRQETIARNLIKNEEDRREKEMRKIENEKERLAKLQQIESEILQGFKTCKTCEKSKPLEFFQKQPSNLGGYHHHCKPCSYLNSRNLVKRRESTRKWQLANPEKKKEHRRKSKSRPIERIKASTKARLRKYLFNKAEAGITYKEIIGCTPKELQAYLTSLFTEGMSWENYGTAWDVDHIIPCRAFDQTKTNHVVKCWNYKNLRPMLKMSNYFKADLLPNGLTARFMAKNDPAELEKIRDKMLVEMGIGLIEPEPPMTTNYPHTPFNDSINKGLTNH